MPGFVSDPGDTEGKEKGETVEEEAKNWNRQRRQKRGRPRCR